MPSNRRRSSAMHDQFRFLVSDVQKQLVIEEEPAVSEDAYHRQSEVVVARGSRTWHIEIDACHGHSDQRMKIGPGIERIYDDEEEEEEEELPNGQELAHTAATGLRVSIMADLLLADPATLVHDVEATTMTQLIEEDISANKDPALSIPMFAPIVMKDGQGPSPIVEIKDDEAKQQLKLRRGRRISTFVGGSISKPTALHEFDPAKLDSTPSHKEAIPLAESLDEDEDGDELLIGFGTRPEKRGVRARKFIRGVKLFRNVKGGLKGEHANKRDDTVHIDDNHFE